MGSGIITKEQALDFIAALQKESPESAAALFQPVEKALTAYYTGGAVLEQAVKYCINQLILDTNQRRTVYEHQDVLPKLPTNYPAGYADIRDLFTGGGCLAELATIKADDFVSAFTYETTGTGSGRPAVSTAKSNTYLTKWAADLSGARAEELAAIEAISSFCEGGSYNAGLAQYFEDHGGIVEAPKTAEIADRVYISGGFKDIIETFGLDIHIPTSVRD